MNLNDFGIRTRITAGLALILFLAVLSTGMSLKNNVSVKFESGEVSGSWIPAIANLGHMKGFVADHYLAVSDRMAGRDTSDAAAFGRSSSGSRNGFGQSGSGAGAVAATTAFRGALYLEQAGRTRAVSGRRHPS